VKSETLFEYLISLFICFYMENKVILIICIFNFFIYFFLSYFNNTNFSYFFYIEQTLMKVDKEEEDVLTLDSINSCNIPSSSGAG
jgi:hypothetical protein